MRAWISRGALVVELWFLRRRPGAVGISTLLVLCAGALGGCAGKSSSSAPGAEVAITDFQTVAGRWTGWLTAVGRPRQDDDQVDLTIAGDGAYAFTVARNVGPFVGKGRFALKDGKLVMDDQQRRATFTLLQGDGGRQLRGDGVLASGAPVWVELIPVQ